MAEGEQNRSEQPTPFKLLRAREKGAVARGHDLGYLTGLATFTALVLIAAAPATDQAIGVMRRILVAAPQLDGAPAILWVIRSAFSEFARPAAFAAAAIFVVVLTFEIIQTGLVFSTEPLRLDFGRLNPAKGIQRLFTVRLLIETVKNVFKLGVYSMLAFFVIRHALNADATSIVSADSLGGAIRSDATRLLIFFVGGAAIFAVLDQLIARRDFLSKMRMSRREVRRELRDREGEPRLKQRRQRLHRELAKASQSLRNIRGADILITNPTHFAVALKYTPRTMHAPMIVSMGSNALALRLKKLAFVYGLVVVEDRALAQALFYKSELNRPVPEIFYRAVADIYIDVNRRRAERAEPAHA